MKYKTSVPQHFFPLPLFPLSYPYSNPSHAPSLNLIALFSLNFMVTKSFILTKSCTSFESSLLLYQPSGWMSDVLENEGNE